MTEPRSRARPKGQHVFDSHDLKAFLIACGDDHEPLPETINVLDEIVTDFIIETCHAAAQCATYSHRQKIKVDDFKFVLRRDPAKLGRVADLMQKQKEIRDAKRNAEIDEGNIVKAQREQEEPGKGRKRKVEGGKEEQVAQGS